MTETSRNLDGMVRESWKRSLEVYEPLRPQLYRCCRYLTRSPWDAEDLAQDTLARAFATLEQLVEPPRAPQAWLFKVALGAVKAALHRGRGKLAEPDAVAERVPVPGALDALCAAFNAHDLERLTDLLLKTATVEVVGATTVYGRDHAGRTVLPGMLFGSQRMASPAEGGQGVGIDPRFVLGVLPVPARLNVRVHRGEPLLLSWYAHHDGEFVRGVTRRDRG